MTEKTKKNFAHTMLSDLSFCVFDLETTGGNHQNDNIIEIGMVIIKNLEITDKKDFLIKPNKKVPDFIQKLTSIRPENLKDAPKIEDVIEEILSFMSDSILVAHNTAFDIPFFNSVLKRLNIPELKNKSICTNMMTKYLIPNLMNSNLSYMSKILGIKHQKAHRALDDALATAELLLNYLNIFIDKNIKKINHIYYPRNRYELDRIHFKRENSNVEEIEAKIKSLKSPYLITVKGENGIILFALPCNKNITEEKYIIKNIKQLDWKLVSIRIFGPFIECLIHFNNYLSKLEQINTNEIIKFLWKEHLPKRKHIIDNKDNVSETQFIGDFLIVNHLVPDQYIVYPIESLHKDSGLIFRYPGHKKKLLQYINAKATRITNKKLKRVKYQIQLKKFIDNYLLEYKEIKSSLFIFEKNYPLLKTNEFITSFEKFLSQNPNSYNYPKEYI